jgi:phthiodiolone/phenolphthiodiolone dimycocerosates ketoreductase
LNRALVSLARLSRLDTVWVNDHWQGEMPSALWDQQFSWAATPGESPHASFDHKVLLGYLAKSAGRLRVGVGVTDPIRHHPVAIAQAFLTLAHMTRRRPILGIGGGERENIEPYGLDFSAPAGRLEEALQIIRLCFSHQGPIDFQGKHYRLERAVMDVRAPKGKTPEIWIGGQGPRMLRLAGQYGDGWLPFLMRSPQEYAAKLQLIREAARNAGRDPQAITPALVQVPIVAPTEQEAQKMLDTKFVRFWALLGSSTDWRKAGVQHPFGEHFRGYVDWVPEQYDRKTLEDALAAVPPGLIGDYFLWGTPKQVAGKLRAYGEVGVRHVGFINLQMLISKRAALYSLWATARIARFVNRRTQR